MWTRARFNDEYVPGLFALAIDTYITKRTEQMWKSLMTVKTSQKKKERVGFPHQIQCELDAVGVIPPNDNFFPQAWFLPTTVPTHHNGKNFHAVYPYFSRRPKANTHLLHGKMVRKPVRLS